MVAPGISCIRIQPMACTPPSTWKTEAVLAGNQSDSSATQAFAVGSGSETSQPSGAFSFQIASKSAKPGSTWRRWS